MKQYLKLMLIKLAEIAAANINNTTIYKTLNIDNYLNKKEKKQLQDYIDNKLC